MCINSRRGDQYGVEQAIKMCDSYNNKGNTAELKCLKT